MIQKLMKVQYVNIKNNFCYLNNKVSEEFGINETIRIQYETGKQAYFTLSRNLMNIPDDVIALSSLYAKCLEIQENSEVLVNNLGVLNKVESFTIFPIKSEDYHILDLLRQEVEQRVLLQVKVVCQNQCIIIWIGENLFIPVNVVSVEPSSPGILCNLTELTIIPYVQKNSEAKLEPETEKNGCEELKKFNSDIFEISRKLEEFENHNERKFRIFTKKLKGFYSRIVPYDEEDFKEFSEYFYEFNTFMSKNGIHPEYRDVDSFKIPIFCLIEPTNHQETKKIYIRIFLINHNNSLISNNIYVNKNLLNILNCKIGAKVKLKKIYEKTPDRIIIIRKNKEENIKDFLREYLAEICRKQEFILNENIPIQLNNDQIFCHLKFEPDSHKYCCVNKDFLRNCNFKIEDDPSILRVEKCEKNEEKLEKFIEIECLRSIKEEILEKIRRNLHGDKFFENFLITGKLGVGKSILMNQLKHILKKGPFFIYSEVIKCKSLKGKTLDSLHKVLISIFENLIKHQPSILFIDDLEILCENLNENDVQAQNSLYFNRISEMVYLLMKWLTLNNFVGIIASTNSIEKLNRNIYSSRGCYLFDNIFEIKLLLKEDREIILKTLLNEYFVEYDFEVLSQKTEGYVFQDLYDLTRKIIFETVKDDDSQKIIREKHVEKALSQMTILSLIDANLNSPGEKDFSNIGGLFEVKKLLMENLYWPIKYSNLFDSSPLRLQSGMLLYGPPGTGKTLLAAAAAKEFGIRLISVKGPELLSKYIGASEQAVRDVFNRAQNAKPCILFFDEFDSLAPRRGHDITGVTDRVVNQLLTQLDGVESLNGVYVLAATSRPDLLDPALLRPGRLDKQILCSLPDKESRMDILRILLKEIPVSDDINLDEIAENTEGYSGADLQSVLYNTQLSTMEHLLLSTEDNKVSDDEIQPITQEMLRKSLLKIKPSLTREEKRKYDNIYSKFQGGSNVDLLKPGTKASLA